MAKREMARAARGARASRPLLLGLLLAAVAPTPLAGENLVSSYCTNNKCNTTVLLADANVLPGFSVTSYQLNTSGLISLCSSDNNACSWDGKVNEFNQEAQINGGGSLTAIPLVFNNAGNTIANFQTMVSSGYMGSVVEFLVSEAEEYDYSAISLDWEPSCWASVASECAWPSTTDISNFYTLIDDLADALHSTGRRLTVAAGSYPPSQCDGGFDQFALCSADSDWPDKCADDLYNVSTCNCCGFTKWFEPHGLCGTDLDMVVNMDTYQDEPFDPNAFVSAYNWYTSAGCSPERVSIGLLTGEATNQEDVDEMFSLISQTGVTEIDIWANAWDTDVPELWKTGLEAFIQQGE